MRDYRASRSARDFASYYRGGKPGRPKCADTGRARCVSRGRKRLAKTLVGCPGQINGLRDHLLNRIAVSPGRTAITGTDGPSQSWNSLYEGARQMGLPG